MPPFVRSPSSNKTRRLSCRIGLDLGWSVCRSGIGALGRPVTSKTEARDEGRVGGGERIEAVKRTRVGRTKDGRGDDGNSVFL